MQLVGYAGAGQANQVVRYSAFKNMIYIGAQSDQSSVDTSFWGSMKEVSLYTTYRGIKQMFLSFSRNQRMYSYDDRSLVAYWKLTEEYT